jgi:hypothetical protein
MKKLVVVIFAVILLGTIFSSCKVHHSCDAYPHHAMLMKKSQKPS